MCSTIQLKHEFLLVDKNYIDDKTRTVIWTQGRGLHRFDYIQNDWVEDGELYAIFTDKMITKALSHKEAKAVIKTHGGKWKTPGNQNNL